MIRVYGIKNCGSVKKALHFFDTHGLSYTFHDFKSSPVQSDKIEEWVLKSNLLTLLNTKGTTYKTLNIKTLNLNDTDKIQWMSEHNLLIKRPVIEYADQLIIGFDPSLYEGIFNS